MAWPANHRHCGVVLVLTCMACSGRSTPVVGVESAAPIATSGHPEALVALRDWGLRDVGEPGFVSVGLLDVGEPVAKLSIYDIRKQAPARSPPDTVVWRSEAPMLDDGVFVLSHFDGGNYNRLGGTFSGFEKNPSQSHVELRPGKGLHMRWKRAEEGFAGLWMHLFDDRVRPADRTYLHTGAAAFLYFEIRGRAGGERLTLRIADRNWDDKGDSLPIGNVATFLPAGHVTTAWQAARVPLSALPRGIEHEELASLILSAETPGSGEVFIRSLALIAGQDTQVPEPREDKRAAPREMTRAMWVWRTASLLRDASEHRQLLELCAAEDIDVVFLQLLPAQKGHRVAEDLLAMLPLIEALHRQGVRVEALDGAPEFALPAHHQEVIDTALAVIASNEQNPPARRFDGIRFDTEPYLLPGFAGPGKEPIMRGYLDALDKVHQLTARAGLPLGADIPFWFDGHDRFQEPIARLDGRPVSEHVMDRVENIAIMAYRTRVYGPDGVIAHVLDEIEYANLTGKDVLIALESVRLPDETLQEFTSDAQAGDILLLRPEGKEQLRMTWFSAAQADDARSLLAASPGARLLRARFESFAPADKLSFYSRGRGALNQAMQAISAELGANSSLRGFALHAFDSLRSLE